MSTHVAAFWVCGALSNASKKDRAYCGAQCFSRTLLIVNDSIFQLLRKNSPLARRHEALWT